MKRILHYYYTNYMFLLILAFYVSSDGTMYGHNYINTSHNELTTRKKTHYSFILMKTNDLPMINIINIINISLFF